MTITKVEYSKLLPTGIYSNERIGFEAELGYTPNTDSTDGYPMIPENPLEAISKLRQLAEQSHKEQYPHLYTENGKPITYSGEVPVQQVDKRTSKEKAIDSHIATIESCTSLDSIKRFKSVVERENIPRLTEAFLNKIKALKKVK